MGGIIEAVKNIPETLSYFLGVETLGLPPNFLTLTMLLCMAGLTETQTVLVRRLYPCSTRRDVSDVSRLDVLICLADHTRQSPNVF